MGRIEILVEEPSMEECLRNLLPRLVPARWILDENYFIRKHQGKSDLIKSVRAKIPVFNHFFEPVSVIIMHDQDSSDCRLLKEEIRNICGSYSHPLLIRIVCRELESWYLGDLDAIEKAYPRFKSKNYQNRTKLKNPDHLNAKDYLKRILPDYQAISSSREISKFLNPELNRSGSFNQFVSGIKRIFV
jgi:hypothetical protein